jgi:hypothetical protein
LGGNTVYHGGNLPGTAITWTAAQTFSAESTISMADPAGSIFETDGPADEKRWRWYASGGDMVFVTLNDAQNATSTIAQITRSGTTVAEIELNATTLDFNGTVDCSGSVVVGTTIELGHASDTTLSRVSAGVVAIEGVNIVTETATQTLTNKTLTSPTINGGTIQSRPQASSETTGTLTSGSANKTIQATGDITINNSVFSAGDIIVVYAGASSRTLTQGSGVTMRLAGTATTGSRTLAARGIATLFFVSASEVAVGGSGVT